MALYDNLPVYKVCYDMLRIIYRVCSTMERSYRFTLGEQLQNGMIEILRKIYRANSNYDKAKHIEAAREDLAVVRLLLRVAHDENQITLKKYIEISDMTESASKQLTAWFKSLNRTG